MRWCYTASLLLVIYATRILTDVVVKNRDNQTVITLASTEASFGPRMSDVKIVGHGRFVKPINGCSPVELAPPSSNVSLPYIGVIRRNDCTFIEKVLNAQKSGFKAAIVYDPDSEDLLTMRGSSDLVKIPAAFIGRTSAKILSIYFDLNYTIEFIRDSEPSYDFFIFPISIAFPAGLAAIVCFLSIRFIHGKIKQWKSRLQSKSILKFLPLKRFEAGDSYEVCAVCIEDFKVNDKLRILPCSHAYHQKCIDPWLIENKRTCPLCNKSIIPEGEEEIDEEYLQVVTEQTPLISHNAASSLMRYTDESSSLSLSSEDSSNRPNFESSAEVHVEPLRLDASTTNETEHRVSA